VRGTHYKRHSASPEGGKTGEWEVKDAGVKGEISIEQEIGNVGAEVKVIEVTAGYRTAFSKEGLGAPLLDLKY